METSITGVDFPPTRQMRRLAKEQLEDALSAAAKYIDKVELFLVEFSAERSRTGTMCSAVIFFHGYSPILVEEEGNDLQRAIYRCVTSVSRAVEERLRERRPGPSGMSILF
jgi:ribosome-associated translation inhibitor RaiA